MPGVALTWRASSRAIASVMFFSRTAVGPRAPGSWPPWPASIATTSGRMPRAHDVAASTWRAAAAQACDVGAVAGAEAWSAWLGGDGLVGVALGG